MAFLTMCPGQTTQKLQELIKAARDEILQGQQELKRLNTRALELEQGRESQEQLLTKVPEELKDVLGFK